MNCETLMPQATRTQLKNRIALVSVLLAVAVLGLAIQPGYAFKWPPHTFVTATAPLATTTTQDCTWLNLKPPFVGAVMLTSDGVNLASVVMMNATGIPDGSYTVWAGYNATAPLRTEHPTTCNFDGAWNQIGSITITSGEGLTAILSPLPNSGHNIAIAINGNTGTLYSTWLLNFTLRHGSSFPP
jgi:hypothetical protein